MSKSLVKNSIGEDLLCIPADDEIEITTFGPNYGECIVVHLGYKSWMIIDCIVNKENKKPVPLEYLEGLQVNIEEDVKLLIPTHWHDDHIRGFGEMFEKCKNADIVISSALKCDEFLKLIATSKDAQQPKTCLNEFDKIVSHINNRRINNKEFEPKHAVINRQLFSETKPEKVHKINVKSLSPTDRAIRVSKEEIGCYIDATINKRLLFSPKRNETAIVVLLEVNSNFILFGSDLEEKNTGDWSTISKELGISGIKIFKIPHHGSDNGFSEEVWSKNIGENCHAIITSFNNGKVSLPTKKGLEDIFKFTENIFLTSPSKEYILKHEVPAVNKTLIEGNFKIIKKEIKFGAIRIRTKDFETINVELFGSAQKLVNE